MPFPNSKPKDCKFVTSSEIYKKMDEKKKRKEERDSEKNTNSKDKVDSNGVSKRTMNNLKTKEKKHLAFVNEISKYTTCITYIEDVIKRSSHNKLDKKYSYLAVINELALVDNEFKIDFIRTKLFEIVLTLTFTDRVAVLFNEDPCSECLRNLWYHNRDYNPDDLKSIKSTNLKTFVDNSFDEEKLISHELKIAR